MRFTSLLLGCLFGLGVVASAAASGVAGVANPASGSNTGSCSCSNHPASAPRDGSASNSDALNLSHASGINGANAAQRGSSDNNASDDNPLHFGRSDNSSDNSSNGSGLGWQSLLPGSIQ